MFLTKDEYNGLIQMQLILTNIIKNAVLSELEEEHEQNFQKLLYLTGNDKAKNIVSKSLIEEVKEMMIQLEIKGSVRERQNGLIEARTQLFGSVYGRTLKELNEKLTAKIKEQLQQPNTKEKQKIKRYPLLSEFYYNSYVPYKKRKNRKNSTLKGYEYHIAFIIRENFDKAMNCYTAKLIEDFLYSISLTRKRQIIQGFLNNVFTRAVAEAVIKNNPCAPLEKMEHNKNDGTAFSFEEQRQFFTKLF